MAVSTEPPDQSPGPSRPIPPLHPPRTPLEVTGDVVLLTAAAALLIGMTFESLRAGARLRWALLGLDAALVPLVALLWRGSSLRFLAGTLLVAFSVLPFGALALEPQPAPCLLLLSRGEEFWAAVVGAAGLFGLAVLGCSSLPRRLWPLPLGLAAVLGSGFLMTLATGAPLRALLAGQARLPYLPEPYLQPHAVCRHALPVCAGLALVLACAALFRRVHARAWAALAVAVVLGLPAGAVRLVPSTAPPVAASDRPSPSPSPSSQATAVSSAGEGEARLTYGLAPDPATRGAADHDVVVRTRGYTPGRPASLSMGAFVRPGTPARVQFGCRAASGAVRSLGLSDIELFEDGVKIRPRTLEKRASRDAHVYLVPLFHDGEIPYRERVCVALSRFAAGFPEQTKLSLVTHEHNRIAVKEIVSRDAADIFRVFTHGAWYSSSDQEVHGFLLHLTNFLDLKGVKDPERLYVAIAEAPIKPDARLTPETVAELRRTGTPVMAIGGEDGGPMEALARALGGIHVPGKTVDEWSPGLERLRVALDYDYVMTYDPVRAAPPAVEVAEPAAGAVVKGTLVVKLSMPKGDPTRVEVSLDGTLLKTLSGPPWELTHDLAGFAGGKHQLGVVPIGPGGERGPRTAVPLVVEHAAPSLRIAGLTDGESVSTPTSVSLRFLGRPLSSLAVTIDGKPVASFTSPVPDPITTELDPAKLGDGPHKLTLEGTTAEGEKIVRVATFQVRRRAVEIEVASPAPNSRVFGQVQIWVRPKANWAGATIQRMVARVTGGLVSDHKVGEVTAAPWLVPWSVSNLAAGPYTISVAVTATDGTTGRVTIPVEVIKPAFAVEFKNPKSGQTVTGPVPLELTVSDESGLGVDRVEFSAAGALLEKKVQPPWCATFDPSLAEEGLVRLSATVYRKDETRAEASATVLVRRLTTVMVPVAAAEAGGPLPASVLLAKTPEVTIAGQPPKSARFVRGKQAAVEMVVVFPCSKSTEGEGNLAPLLAELERFVRRMSGTATVGLVRYSDTVQVSAERMTPLAVRLESLKIPFPRSGRALYDAIAAGAQALGSTSPRRLLVLLVDGPDAKGDRTGAASRHTGAEALKLVKSREIEFHVIGFGRDLAPNLQATLGRFAALTGGTSASLQGAAQLPGALDAIRSHLDSQVLLEMVPTVDQLKSGLFPLTVSIPGETDLKLLHRSVVSVR